MNDSSTRVPTSRNVSRAIARSRAVRASLARRRRRLLAIAACAGALVGVPLVWSIAEPAAVVAAAAASQARDLASLFGERSPGTRTQAELTKHARVANKVRPQPKQAAHEANPLAPGIVTTGELVDKLQPPLAPVGILTEALQPPFGAPPTLNTILASIDQPSSPPGGGGPNHFPTSEPRDAPPLSAVPEPGTWAMMLVGFGLVAWRSRRRKPAEKARRARA